MIKNFDEFISYQETIEEGKVKNIAIAAGVSTVFVGACAAIYKRFSK